MSGWAPTPQEPQEGAREPLGATGLPASTERALGGAAVPWPGYPKSCSVCGGSASSNHRDCWASSLDARNDLWECLVCKQTRHGARCQVCGWNKPVLGVPVVLQPRKHDAGKATMPELLPFGALEQVCAVFAYGARKYEPHNYRKGAGLAWSRLLGAALRHLFAWGRGEDNDPETGYSHLAHAACCCLMLLDGAGTDDRFKTGKCLVDADWGAD